MVADATVGGTEREIITVTTTGWTVEELIMIGALGITREAPDNEGRQNGKEVLNISCRKLVEGNMRLIRFR